MKSLNISQMMKSKDFQKRSVDKKRHLAKAVTWRIIASLTTALIAWAFGLPPKAIGGVFVADLIIKFIMYYAHERVWYKHIKYGVNNV